MKIKLNKFEFAIAVQVGTYRQMSNLNRGRKDAYGAIEENGWSLHIEGACGEAAAAKALGYYWSGNMSDLAAADINSNKLRLEVRTRSREYYELIIHDNEDDNAAFILLTGKAPNFTLVGWCYGYEGKKPEYYKDPTGYRPLAYFVPHEKLRPINELINIIHSSEVVL